MSYSMQSNTMSNLLKGCSVGIKDGNVDILIPIGDIFVSVSDPTPIDLDDYSDVIYPGDVCLGGSALDALGIFEGITKTGKFICSDRYCTRITPVPKAVQDNYLGLLAEHKEAEEALKYANTALSVCKDKVSSIDLKLRNASVKVTNDINKGGK